MSLIEIHMLQNHSPSNLNRDDTGSPKDALFGGSRRGRISSQCIKRSIRLSDIFKNEVENNIGYRTRRLPLIVKKILMDEYKLDEGKADEGARICMVLGKKDKEAKKGNDGEAEKLETAQLMFFDNEEVNALASKINDILKLKKLPKDLYNELEEVALSARRKSVDIALFGRMTTDKFLEDVNASSQVAHAISTMKVETEFDYFTAADDIASDQKLEDKGAGHIGDVEFNSVVYYKYFSINFNSLVNNIGGDKDLAKKTVSAFIKGAAMVNPSGKQNTFAAHNLPDFIQVEVKKNKIPTSYANSFLKAVEGTYNGKSCMENSIDSFLEYSSKLKNMYPIGGNGWFISTQDEIEHGYCNRCDDLDKLIDSVLGAVE